MVRWQQIGRRVALLANLTAAAFLIAHTVNAFVSAALYVPLDAHVSTNPQVSVSRQATEPSRDVADILASGLFPLPHERSVPGPGGLATEGVGGVSAPPLDVARKINVLGTVVGDREGVLAVVEDVTTKRQTLYRLHDVIPNVGELAEIRHSAVLIRLGYQEEWVELAIAKQAAPPAAQAGTVGSAQAASAGFHRVLDRREVAQVTADVPKLLTQARAIPHMVNGKMEGFRIDNILPQGFYDRIGIHGGDVLQRVNGVEIRDPGTMLALFQQLKNERAIKLDVLRDNQQIALTYEIR